MIVVHELYGPEHRRNPIKKIEDSDEGSEGYEFSVESTPKKEKRWF